MSDRRTKVARDRRILLPLRGNFAEVTTIFETKNVQKEVLCDICLYLSILREFFFCACVVCAYVRVSVFVGKDLFSSSWGKQSVP